MKKLLLLLLPLYIFAIRYDELTPCEQRYADNYCWVPGCFFGLYKVQFDRAVICQEEKKAKKAKEENKVIDLNVSKHFK